jgi:adenylate cyclase
VLAKMQAQGPLIQPAPGQRRAVGGGENIRSVNLPQDADGVIRNAPLRLPIAGKPGEFETGFALELARRADPNLRTPDAPDMVVNFDGGTPFLTFSLADIHACAAAGKAEYFASQFKDRVVLLATGLDVEDRLMTSRRFINRGENLTAPRCTPTPEQGMRRVEFARATMPGVFVHAAAIDNLLRGEVMHRPGGAARGLAVAGVAGLAAVPALLLPIGWAAAALGGVLLGVIVLATMAFQYLLALPLIEALAAALLTFALLLAFRFAVSDRDKRRIRHMFGLYLAPSVIEKMIATGQLPALGGERREMTFLFSDIAGFTTMTEAADPAVLLPALNRYLEGLFEVVMKHGGLVMDFAGDGVIAIFGAPADMPDHAARAVACAREMDAFTEAFRGEVAPTGLRFGHTRIGLHTGEATVGNFGAARRLKYTAMGDVVNAASRLEGLNKYFGTRVCMSQETREASGDTDNRPLGSFVVKGKAQAIDVYELLPPGADSDPATLKYRAAYGAQARGEAAAESLFAELAATAPEDGAIAFHLGRARAGERTVRVLMDSK